MDSRTRTETVTFANPFRLKSVPDLMPAGSYTMEVEEELIEGLSFPAWRRTVVTITPAKLPPGRLRQCWPVVPAELDAALDADRKATP